MPDPVLITEVLRRADAGVSVNPFICRTEDGREIYVKPAGTLPESLVYEWLGSSLAREMNLPVADFTLIDLPTLLVDSVMGIDTSGLNAGIGFGSYHVGTGCRDMEIGDIGRMSPGLMAEILAFDLWIHNGDRILNNQGGNPNLVIGPDQEESFLIDHDNAFDPNFSPEELRSYHLGWNQRSYWLCAIERQIWEAKTRSALERLPEFWKELPESWLERSPNLSKNPSRALDSICANLMNPSDNSDAFWAPLISPQS